MASNMFLAHVHILPWLKKKLRADDIDSIISAEIPDPASSSILHKIEDDIAHDSQFMWFILMANYVQKDI